MASYLILDNPLAPRAQAISRALFRLSRPDGVADPADVTKYLLGWVTHPTTGEEAMGPIPAGPVTVNLHLLAEKEGWIDAIKDVVTDNAERQEIRDWFDANVGTRPNIKQMPHLFQALGTVTSEEDMQAAGWFPEPEVP